MASSPGLRGFGAPAFTHESPDTRGWPRLQGAHSLPIVLIKEREINDFLGASGHPQDTGSPDQADPFEAKDTRLSKVFSL